MIRKSALLLCLSLCLPLAACGEEDDGPLNQPPGNFGEVTSAVVIVNPRINQGSTTAVASGEQRSGVALRAGDGAPVTTDASGLAVVQGFPIGAVPLVFDTGSVTLNVAAEKELYDVVVSYKPSGVQEIIPAVRYPIAGTVKVLEPGADIAAAATEDGTIILLRAGTYPGNFELTSEGVLIFGDWTLADGQRSIIEGNVTARGGNIRLRGVKVTGTLTSNANGFSAAFCDLGGANLTGNGVSLLRNNFSGAGATVPSSNSVLVDNAGIP